MNNKKLVAGFIIAASLTVPFATSALSIDELQQQIKDLLAKVASLQLQIRQQSASSTETSVSGWTTASLPRICAIMNRNLSRGHSGDDVSGLQEFLSTEGFLNASATGFFGPATASALAKWQSSNGISAIGSFGPLTRERIKIRCSNEFGFRVAPQAGNAPLTITAAANVGGLTTYRYAIDFGDGSARESIACNAPADACIEPGKVTHTYTKDGTYTVALYRTSPGGCGQNADPRCLGAPAEESIIAKETVRVGTVACTKEYNPVCGAKPVVCITTPCNPVPTTYGNLCTMKADGATLLYSGACKDTTTNPESDAMCKTWNDGCNSCGRSSIGGPAYCTLKYCSPETTGKPYCTAYFDEESSGNRPPVISSFSGPTSLSVNEIGTWKITATDPENGTLKYSILWGDEWTAYDAAQKALAPSTSIQQNTSFTHSYANSGNYTVKLTVTDGKGASAYTSATVQISQTACTGDYAPVCGRPNGCANTCPPGMYCTLMCQMHQPQTYSNRCQMNNSNATFMHDGACTGNEGYLQ